MPFSTWPPPEAEFYREFGAATPVWQGDVFNDVPLVKARSTGSPARQPELAIERRMVLVATYACDLYKPRTATLSHVVAVVPLIDVTNNDASAWRGGMYSRFPLVRRGGGTQTYAADLQVPSTVDSNYLVTAKRLLSLTLPALAFLHQRLMLASTRVASPLDYHEVHLGPVEHERRLWEQWVASGGTADDFEMWLDRPLAMAGGAPPRRWLEKGQYPFLDGAARQELLQCGQTPTF